NERVSGAYADLAAQLKNGEGPETQPGSTFLVKTQEIDPLTGRPRLTAPSTTAPATAAPVAMSPTTMPGRSGTTRPGTATRPAGAGRSDISAKPLEDASKAQLTAGSKVKPLTLGAPLASGVTPTQFEVLMVR